MGVILIKPNQGLTSLIRSISVRSTGSTPGTSDFLKTGATKQFYCPGPRLRCLDDRIGVISFEQSAEMK